MEEIWKSIENYKGYYEISNLGNVRNSKLKILSASIWGKYRSITFSVNKVRETFSIHVLVARHFIPNPENKRIANHKDGNKLNNNALNLEWTTYSENNQHAFDNGLKLGTWKDKYRNENPTSKPIIQYTKNGDFVNRFECAREANRITGINYKHISDCCLGKRFTTGGYCWKFDVSI